LFKQFILPEITPGKAGSLTDFQRTYGDCWCEWDFVHSM